MYLRTSLYVISQGVLEWVVLRPTTGRSTPVSRRSSRSPARSTVSDGTPSNGVRSTATLTETLKTGRRDRSTPVAAKLIAGLLVAKGGAAFSVRRPTMSAPNRPGRTAGSRSSSTTRPPARSTQRFPHTGGHPGRPDRPRTVSTGGGRMPRDFFGGSFVDALAHVPPRHPGHPGTPSPPPRAS